MLHPHNSHFRIMKCVFMGKGCGSGFKASGRPPCNSGLAMCQGLGDEKAILVRAHCRSKRSYGIKDPSLWHYPTFYNPSERQLFYCLTAQRDLLVTPSVQWNCINRALRWISEMWNLCLKFSDNVLHAVMWPKPNFLQMMHQKDTWIILIDGHLKVPATVDKRGTISVWVVLTGTKGQVFTSAFNVQPLVPHHQQDI